MTGRDRLIELLKTPNKTAILRKTNPQFVTDETDEESIVADYLLANGVVVPPCPIGTKIYMLVTKRARINLPEFTFIKESKLTFLNLERVIAQFGKTVFLTKPEAEAKLKELVK